MTRTLPLVALLIALPVLACGRAERRIGQETVAEHVETRRSTSASVEERIEVNARRHAFDEAPALLWPRLAAEYASLRIPVDSVDDQRRVVRSVRVPLDGEPFGGHGTLLRCEEDAAGATPRPRFAVLTASIRADGRGSIVRAEVAGYADAATAAPMDCVSTRALEERLVKALRSRR